ncbi:hypothetical protein Nepgr_031564 [Nepenthes gracilis]|uniref:Uncharacterized protein n=1 Tax=Nepenthes gracilis TaxID=150966 RepID=A0AAD3TIR2_NEPGR|nr:hypothetical protein Nepgr_031564 [Nepenthes gracilis]
MCRWIWTASASLFQRWPGIDFSLATSIFRRPDFNFSYFTTATAGWGTQSFRQINFWVVDNLLWTVVTLDPAIPRKIFHARPTNPRLQKRWSWDSVSLLHNAGAPQAKCMPSNLAPSREWHSKERE